ncbi:MAG: hypothetical protein IJZ23_02810 [Roseburia sp.]|nr:hypothetical protein [Roseburia sp.]
MKQNYDELLRHALTPKDEPDFWLNQKILRQVREKKSVEKRKYKRIPAAVLAAALVLGAGSLTVVAAWKYLMPNQIAEEVQDKKLAEAFMGEDAVFVNETQSYGGYRVTFLGIVSGEQLSEGLRIHDGVIHEDRSHIVVAIENVDGTPMPDTSEDAYGELEFFVSPFIKGYNPVDYNAYVLAGNYTDIVEDGVLYRLLECDNVEMFADCGLYLGVQDSTFYHAKAYCYDEATGEISRNESYDGLNALFQLPIDVAKADPEAAKAYMEGLFSDEGGDVSSNGTDLEDTIPEGVDREEYEAVQDWIAQLSPENINEFAERVESTVQVLNVDEEGYIEIGAYEIEGRGGRDGGSRMLVSWAFPDAEVGMQEQFIFCSSGTFDTLRVETFTKNEDGTFTFAVYIPREQ